MKLLKMTMLILAMSLFLNSTLLTAETTNQNSYETNLDIVAYNVYLMSSTLEPNWGQDQRANLISEADFMKNQDVVVLNELFDNNASDQLLNQLSNQYPYQTPILGSTTNNWDETRGSYSYITPESGGVSILSKWPIEEKIQHVFDDACGPESLSNKGFVYTKILKNEDPYHVIGTHLQSTDSNCSEGEPEEVRTAQMQEIKDFIESKNIPESEMLIISGDLNVKKSSEEYNSMINQLNVKEPMYTGFDATWDPESNSIAEYNYPELDSQFLDYIFTSNNHAQPNSLTVEAKNIKSPLWSVSSWGTTYEYNDYSDHYPVFGSIQNN
ncbi:sphingomyelin phosphodiesterase [Alkalibacillus almallahensis]|uniref:sphingomyelin phosphodiesterase n=1 Tax=Alkalibacillus almallahensis TaxID=1379154 RepID=UPI001ABAA45A|nr:sphingomyelin phosphodiesterase [Alkalibacillus almallahensis]NIK13401.1 sphingomyelin phosphodiesterase [Alkalibacillus almallahensis]